MARKNRRPLAFEVLRNGRRLCNAGVEGGDGVLTTILTWVGGPRRVNEAHFRVGGLDSRDSMHLAWAHGSLRAGDEIVVRVREGGRLDPPKKRYRIEGKGGG